MDFYDKYITIANAISALNKNEINNAKIASIFDENLKNFMLVESSSYAEINEIDTEMIPAIQHLNRLGFKTNYSCVGHYNIFRTLQFYYTASQSQKEITNEFVDILRNRDSSLDSQISEMYISFTNASNSEMKKLLPPSTADWFVDESSGKCILRCIQSNSISMRDSFLSDFINNLTKLNPEDFNH